MPQETLDYRSPIARDLTGQSNRAAGVVAAAVVAANLLLICIVLIAPGLGPAVALPGVPLVNFCLSLVSLGCTPLARKYAAGGSVKRYVVASVIAPFVLCVIDVAVFSRLVFPNGVGH
jgi:hypothetical protein